MTRLGSLGSLCRSARLAAGLSVRQLAERIGYRNVQKGIRRIHALETAGTAHPNLLASVVRMLGLRIDDMERALREDWEAYVADWTRWAEEPIRPSVIVRPFAGIVFAVDLPDYAPGREDAEAYSAALARRYRARVCLVWSRRESVWFSRDGAIESRTAATPTRPNAPFMMTTGGRRFVFDFARTALIRRVSQR